MSFFLENSQDEDDGSGSGLAFLRRLHAESTSYNVAHIPNDCVRDDESRSAAASDDNGDEADDAQNDRILSAMDAIALFSHTDDDAGPEASRSERDDHDLDCVLLLVDLDEFPEGVDMSNAPSCATSIGLFSGASSKIANPNDFTELVKCNDTDAAACMIIGAFAAHSVRVGAMSPACAVLTRSGSNGCIARCLFVLDVCSTMRVVLTDDAPLYNSMTLLNAIDEEEEEENEDVEEGDAEQWN